MTIEEKRRELFEAWALSQGWTKSHTMRHELWLAFNAALDAVVIERPSLEYEMHAEIKMRARFQDAIESTGLGLKVKP